MYDNELLQAKTMTVCTKVFKIRAKASREFTRNGSRRGKVFMKNYVKFSHFVSGEKHSVFSEVRLSSQTQ